MKSTEATTSFDPFKSKKVPRSATKKQESSQLSSNTPEKPANPPRRGRKCRAAVMSLNQIRQAAENLRPGPPSYDLPAEAPAEKSNKVSQPSLPEKRFSYGHLAQLKFILPEAIETQKVLIRDEVTSCMKPDLRVILNVNAIENGVELKPDSASLRVRKVFKDRLLKYCVAHPESDDVPEERLPEPFNKPIQVESTMGIKDPNMSLAHETPTEAPSEQLPAAASLLPPSFKRHFSKKFSTNAAADIREASRETKAVLASEPTFDQGSYKNGARELNVLSPVKMSSEVIFGKKGLATFSPSPATPVKNLDCGKNEDCSSMKTTGMKGTPARLISTPKLMSTTPALQPPKRSFMTPEDGPINSPTKLFRRQTRSRSLKFDTPIKNETTPSGSFSASDDISDIIPQDLQESIREKERKALEEKNPAISQAKWRKKMIASLPKLFDTLLFFFRSINRSVITKEELVHRIISSRLDILDRREIEEQLRLLQELAPEWVYEKQASTGDLLFCVNKISSPEAIRTRLAEAQ